MKKFQYNVFIWLSGADPLVLGNCTISEARKFIKLGMMVLVPAMLSWIGVWVAAPYIGFNLNPARAILSTGWSLIILIVDTFMVSTLDKRIAQRSRFYLLGFFRIIVSLFIGMVISHPLVLKIFEPSIIEQMQIMHRDKISKMRRDSRDSSISFCKVIDTSLAQVRHEIMAKGQLLTAEGNGQSLYNEFGSSWGVGHAGIGPRYHKLQQDIKKAQLNYDSLSTEKKKIKNQFLIVFKRDSANEVFNADYLKRTLALDQIEEKDKIRILWICHVSFVVYCLIIFFILVDSLAVIAKLITPLGQYEEFLTKHENVLNEKFSRDNERQSLELQKEDAVLRDTSEMESQMKKRLIQEVYNRSANYKPEQIQATVNRILYGDGSDKQNFKDQNKTLRFYVFLIGSFFLGIVLWFILHFPYFNFSKEGINMLMGLYFAIIQIIGGFLIK